MVRRNEPGSAGPQTADRKEGRNRNTSQRSQRAHTHSHTQRNKMWSPIGQEGPGLGRSVGASKEPLFFPSSSRKKIQNMRS